MSVQDTKAYYVSNKKLNQTYIDWFIAIKVHQDFGLEGELEIPPFIVDSMIRIANRLSFHPNFINYTFKDEMVSDALYDCVRFAKKFNPNKILHKAKLSNINGKIRIKDILVGATSGHIGTISFSNSKTGQISLKMPLGKDFFQGEIVTTGTSSATIQEITTHLADNPFAYITTICSNAFLRRIDKEKTQKYIKAMIVNDTANNEFFDNQSHEEDGQYANQYIEFLREIGHTDDCVPMSIKRTKKYQQSLMPAGPLDEFEND